MRIDEGNRTLSSRMGAFCSILLVIIVIGFASYKISILEGKKSIDILSIVVEDSIDDTEVFSAEQGLNIAAAVYSPFDTSRHVPIDPSFGRIKFTKVRWGTEGVDFF